MSNGKVVIVHLLVGPIKKTYNNFIECTYKK